MAAAILCREMGWTWEEYQNTPYPFIQNLLAMLQAEAEAAERERKKYS